LACITSVEKYVVFLLLLPSKGSRKENMQEKVKIFLSDLLDRAGVVSLLRHAIAVRGGLVLALHRVLPVEERMSCYDPHLVLSEPAFVSLLRLLQQDYCVVPLEELLADPLGIEGRPKVALTFDVGSEDNYRVAFPHLLAYQTPATIFACTELLGTSAVLPEERFARLWAECTSRARLKELLVDLRHWGMGRRNGSHLQSQRRYWSQELKRMPLTARLLLLDHFEHRYAVPQVATRRFMSWGDVRIMINTGLIRMGSHTSRHATLTSETDRDIRRELEDSRATLLERTGTISEIFAYPNGMYNRRVIDLVRSAGFKAALSTNPGTTNRKSNPFAIPRIAVDNTTVTDAEVKLSPSRTSVYFLSSPLRSATSC
jgi:peptidoglycan/xylan/chitin deacetylase (PgdA/CDA1 family)